MATKFSGVILVPVLALLYAIAWWREPAKLKRLTMKLVADPQTELVQYDNNEIDGLVCQPAEFAQATKPNGPRSAKLRRGFVASATNTPFRVPIVRTTRSAIFSLLRPPAGL